MHTNNDYICNYRVCIIDINSKIQVIICNCALALRVFWTVGILSYARIPLSIITASIGAIIIGLGAEYGIFMVLRYNEELKKGKPREDRIVAMVAGVGSGTIGSSSTTIAGFMALALSSMPMMIHLGIALSLGIVSCLIGALVFLPSIMALREW